MATERVTEIAVWSSYTPGPVEEEVMKIVAEQEGFLAFRRGAQVDDGSIGYWAVDWEGVEYHHKFRKAQIYPSILEKARGIGKLEKVVHVKINPFPPVKALEAPVTEIVFRTLKDQAFKADLETTLGTLRGLMVKAEGIAGAAMGVTVEDENLYVAIVGWQSMEAFTAARGHPAGAPIFEAFAKISDAEFKHANFSTFISKE